MYHFLDQTAILERGQYTPYMRILLRDERPER